MFREQRNGHDVFPLFPSYNPLRGLDLSESNFIHNDESSLNKVKKYILIYKEALKCYLDSALNYVNEQGFKIESKVDSCYDLSVILSNDEEKNKSFEDTIRYLFGYNLLDFYSVSKNPFYQMPCMKGIDDLIEKHEKEQRLKECI
jgi:hypothetical protein